MQTTILNKVKDTRPQENTPQTTKIMQFIQCCIYGMHHLTALSLYELRTVNVRPQNQLTMTECNAQLEKIIEDPSTSAIDKMNEITPILQAMHNKKETCT